MLSGPPPADLSLPLPRGSSWPTPPLDIPDPNLTLPAYGFRQDNGTSVSWIWDRSTAATIAAAILMDRLTEELRHQQGLIYSPVGSYIRLNQDLSHFAFAMDAVPEASERVRDGILRIVRDLATTGPRPDELTHQVERYRRAEEFGATIDSHLDYVATQLVFRSEDIDSPEKMTEEIEGLRAEDVAATLSAGCDTAIVQGPKGVKAPADATFSEYPMWSTDGIDGRTFPVIVPNTTSKRFSLRRKAPPRRDVLHVGPTGVGVLTAAGRWATVRYDRCAAVIEERDGSRVVWGKDGTSIWVKPEKWELGADAVALVDAQRPAELVVPSPPENEPLQTP
jgi:zinc protease